MIVTNTFATTLYTYGVLMLWISDIYKGRFPLNPFQHPFFFYKYTIWCKFTLWELLVLHGTKILWLFSAKRQSGTDSQILIMNLHKAKDLDVNVHNISFLKIKSLHCYFLLLGVSVKTLWKKPCYRELDIESHDRNQMIKQVCAAYFTLWRNCMV